MEDEDLDLCNPLSMEEDNPYQEFYKVQQLVDEIDMDLQRCCIKGVDDDFFQEERILSMMRGVLTVWASDNPETSYRQGMHEVLGVVLLALLPLEALSGTAAESADEDVDTACVVAMTDIAQIEADSHCIFNYIMKDLQTLYVFRRVVLSLIHI